MLGIPLNHMIFHVFPRNYNFCGQEMRMADAVADAPGGRGRGRLKSRFGNQGWRRNIKNSRQPLALPDF
jgi:hypothetical protein